MTEQVQISPREAREALAARAALSSLEAFIRTFPPVLGKEPYFFGCHIVALLAMLQRATEAVEDGRCFYGIFICPFRHGKSGCAARRWPAWHLLRNPTHEVILATYSGLLATDLSYDARACYLQAAPTYGLGMLDDRSAVAAWRTTAGGAMYAVGLGGTITGRGAHVLLIDDYVKSREEAESRVMRDKAWDSFRYDLYTRIAAAHAIVICCTRWHEDDLVGRVLREMGQTPSFPQFEIQRFPALSGEGEWLFPERYPESWYEHHRMMLGTYGWHSQMQGDPKPREGNLLKVELAKRYTGDSPECRWARGWDLASTTKERQGEDPDYTAGVKVGRDVDGDLWVPPAVDGDADVVHGRWEAPERNRIILATAERDGPAVSLFVEAVAGYKDAAVEIGRALKGKASVTPRPVRIDKGARASSLEAYFEAGRVHVPVGPRGDELLAELGVLPEGRHDDLADAFVLAARELVSGADWLVC